MPCGKQSRQLRSEHHSERYDKCSKYDGYHALEEQ